MHNWIRILDYEQMSNTLRWHERFPDYTKQLTLEEYAAWLKKAGRDTAVVKTSIDFAKRKRDQGAISCYIAGPLTYVGTEDKERYVKTAEICEGHGFFGYVPHMHLTDPKTNPLVTPNEVRDIDFLWAAIMADLHINFLFPIAQGNGIEEGWAEDRHIPAIYVAPVELRLSRLVAGMRNRIHTVFYRQVDDCFPLVDRYLDLMRKWLNAYPGKNVIDFVETRLELF